MELGAVDAVDTIFSKSPARKAYTIICKYKVQATD